MRLPDDPDHGFVLPEAESGSRSRGVFQALVFSLGIIVLFSSLGLVATAILGPFGAVQLGSNPWVNAFIALVFLAFGLSLLGAFEITIPSSVLTSMDRASQRGGLLGTLLMGLTFSLTAFACVGPFVGTLLAGSVTGGGNPAAGGDGGVCDAAWRCRSSGWRCSRRTLGRLPKSGSWMARVKVVLGFVILAAMLKYASNVDAVLQMELPDQGAVSGRLGRAVRAGGLYLLGLLRLEGIRADEKLGIWRLLIGRCVPGLRPEPGAGDARRQAGRDGCLRAACSRPEQRSG